MTPEGHLFVAHGRLEWIAHDYAIVPVGQEYRFRPYWMPVLHKKVPPRPERWESDGYGKAPDRENLWVVSIGGAWPDRVDEIVGRVERSLAEIKDEAGQPFGDRSLPLIAVPVFGIRGGGLGGRRGEVIGTLVERLSAAARRIGVDVVVSTPDAAVYAALQYARRDLLPDLPEPFADRAQVLAELARDGKLALFLGAGVSVPAGLPSWSKLIAELTSESPDLDPADLEGLSAIDQAELIEKGTPEGFSRRVARLAKKAPRPSLLHALLAGLDAHQVVTTNYDRLYERAVRATGKKVASVMPWTAPLGADRWILKLHGDTEHPDMIVLTRRHMVRYDASNRPSAALLQSLFLTKHLLVVGASLTDDNVIRLAHEVQAYRDDHQGGGAGHFGTVLDVGGGRVRARLWNKELEWLHLDECDPDATNGARALELFVDRIGFHASRSSAWLLDDRFEGLLGDPEDVALARAARDLYERLPQRDNTKWRPLVEQLERLGARK